MKKTLLMSLLAFMVLPLVAQKPAINDCVVYTHTVEEVGIKYIFLNPDNDNIEYRAWTVDIVVDDYGVGYIYNPFKNTTRQIRITYPETSGDTPVASILDLVTGEEIGPKFQCSCACGCCGTKDQMITFSKCNQECTDCTGCSDAKCGKVFGHCKNCWEDPETPNGCYCRYVEVE